MSQNNIIQHIHCSTRGSCVPNCTFHTHSWTSLQTSGAHVSTSIPDCTKSSTSHSAMCSYRSALGTSEWHCGRSYTSAKNQRPNQAPQTLEALGQPSNALNESTFGSSDQLGTVWWTCPRVPGLLDFHRWVVVLDRENAKYVHHRRVRCPLPAVCVGAPPLLNPIRKTHPTTKSRHKVNSSVKERKIVFLPIRGAVKRRHCQTQRTPEASPRTAHSFRTAMAIPRTPPCLVPPSLLLSWCGRPCTWTKSECITICPNRNCNCKMMHKTVDDLQATEANNIVEGSRRCLCHVGCHGL
jgi:hypothetical protein